jgi:hypothetical protein
MAFHPYMALRHLAFRPMNEPSYPWSMPVTSVMHVAIGLWCMRLATKRVDRERMRKRKSDA